MKNIAKIDYSIVSRGTEKYINHGYMAVTKTMGKYKYILNKNHGVMESTTSKDSLKFSANYSIENIAFSRFQLITALMYKDHSKEISDNILILGLGDIGLTCLFYLLDHAYNNITIYIRKPSKNLLDLVHILKQYYNKHINIIVKLEKIDLYNTFIDTTGASSVLKRLFENITYGKKVIILSTPRDEKYLISPLLINRKNITIIGGHELNGHSYKERNKMFNKLLKINSNKSILNKFINIYSFNTKKLLQIKKKKENFIEIFKY